LAPKKRDVGHLLAAAPLAGCCPTWYVPVGRTQSSGMMLLACAAVPRTSVHQRSSDVVLARACALVLRRLCSALHAVRTPPYHCWSK